MCSATASERGTYNKKISQSLFPQVDIIEDEETEILAEIVNSDQIVNILDTDIERSLSCKGRMTTSQMLKDADKRRKLRREKRNHKRATVMITSGAITFLVMAATLVTALS
jgi:hypothetical protein